VWAFLASWSHFACPFASLLSIRGGFPTIAWIFLLLLPLIPHVWWFNNRNFHAILSASTSLQCFHLFWNICIYIQSSFHCALKQEQKILWNHGTRKS
jgi:hypothetical protein